MATTARQQYFADESSLQKDSREFSIANDIQQKIDSVETWAQVNVIETVKVNGTALTPDSNKAVDIDVPDVIDNLYTVDSDNALSAKQWKILYDYIQNLQSVGRFLSNWDCATWLPTTNPSENPYVYHAWDYYMVSNVATSPATNYKPNGSSYTSWVASVTVETNNISVSDRYIYDGTNWLLLSNSWSSITIDSSLSTTSTNPVENRVITNTLNSKQDALTAWDNISISNNTISADVNVKSFYLTWETWQTNLDTAQEAYEWQDAWNEAIIIYGPDRWIAWLSASWNTWEYRYLYDSWSWLVFVATTPVEQSSSQWVGGRSLNKALLTLTVSGWQVTAITKANSVVVADFLSTSQTNHPFSPTNNYDPATKKYVDDSISGITIPTVNDTTISFTQNGASVWDITLNQSSAETIALIDTTYTAGTWIAILNINKNARQWPAPDGFHVPALTEWQWLNTIIGSIFSDAWIMNTWNNWKINLHMPFAGRRDASSAGISLQWTGGCYWTSSPYGATDAHNFYLNSWSVYLTYGDYRASAISIRAFKDIFEAPTSSWTVILGTLGSAWIFRDQTNWLISITSDWTTGYTIMDKNLWATAVYNDWDALSEANCGTYFQRGNNYGFAWTWNITTSTQKVDASAYWPWNYYNSSTFIRATWDWSSVQNDDLWWDTTWTIVINNAITNTWVTSVNWQTWDITIQTGWNYSAGTWINISNQNVISADTTVVATQTDVNNKVSKWINQISGQLFSIEDTYGNSTNFWPDYIRIDFNDWIDSGSAGLQRDSLWATANNKISNLTSDSLALKDDLNLTQTTYAEDEITVVDNWYWTSETYQFSWWWNNQIARLKDVKTYTASTWINIDSSNNISNTLPWPTIAATAPTGTEWALWYDTANDVLMAHDWTAWKEAWTQMKVLSYGHSTWQDFINAYNENAIVYCRASSQANPATWNQTRMAFMAYVNSATPTEVEFQYYRSRDSHNTAANQLDQVFVYKLTSASWWTWTVTERNTWAKAVAWTWISLWWGSGNMTISADTTVLATQTDLNSKQDTLVSWTNIKTINSNPLLGSWNLILNDVKVSAVAPSSPTEWMAWYDSTNDVLKTYDWSNWNECWAWWGWVEVFDITQYGIGWDWTDIITSCVNNNTLTILLDVWEDDDVIQKWWVKWLVTEYDDWAASWTWRISAMALFNLNWVGSAVPYPKSNKLVATFNTTTKYCTGITQSYTEFVPTNSWSTGNVLTKTANGYQWQAPTGWIWISSQSDNILTSWATIRAGTQSDYENLGTYDNNTIYITI